jgi:hypothetical protein
MRTDIDERYLDAPLPTASKRKDVQFQGWCANGTIVMESYHHPQKFAQAGCYLPEVTQSIFFKKKKKMGGISTICLRPFVRGKFNCGKLCVSQNAARS